MSTNINELKGSRVKKKHFKPKHQKAKVFRANEPLLSVFMWGVNHTITGLTHVNVPVMLMPDDFKAFSKIRVDNHHFNKENMPSHFKVKEYCPLVFRNLRERFGINESDFVNSLTKSQPVPMDSKGRNGAKLYQSFDKMFVIKVLQSEEVESMHVLLKQYHPYIVEKHGKTFLPQYLGLYRLTVEGAETYLAVMRNIFSTYAKVHCKYDLKGTTVDREAGTKEKIKELPTLKDGDFVREGCKLHVGEEKEKLLELLNSDVEFLSRMHVIEYSICLGIHDCQIAEEEASIERERIMKEARANSFENGSVATDEGDSTGSGMGEEFAPTPPDSPHTPRIMALPNGERKTYKDAYAIQSSTDSPRREIYYLALVDILSHHGVRKRTTATISNMQPEQYARRLVDFMSKVML